MRPLSIVSSLVLAVALGCSSEPRADVAASSAAPIAASNTAERVASAAGSAAEAALQAYSPVGEGFAALMLTPVAIKSKEDGTKVFSAQRPDGSAFTVICPLRAQASAPDGELFGFKEGVLKDAQIVEDRVIAVDGMDGYEVSAKKEKNGKHYRLYVRVLGKTRRMCAFVSAIPAGIDHPAETRAFLDSARVLE